MRAVGVAQKVLYWDVDLGRKMEYGIVMVSERRRCIPILALVKAITFCLLKTASISQFSVSAIFCILANNHRGAQKMNSIASYPLNCFHASKRY